MCDCKWWLHGKETPLKCENCVKEALYVYKPARAGGLGYCAAHLPRFLKDRALAGLLETTKDFEAAQTAAFQALNAEPAQAEEAPVRKRKAKAAEPVVEDAPVEEPIIEDAPEPVVEDEAVSDEADS